MSKASNKAAATKAIKEVYPNISKEALEGLLINIEIETSWTYLTEIPQTWDEWRAGKKLKGINKNLDAWAKGFKSEEEAKKAYAKLSSKEQLGIAYKGDPTAKFAGGMGALMNTSANYMGLDQWEAEMEDVASGLNMTLDDMLDKMSTDFEFATKVSMIHSKDYKGMSEGKLNAIKGDTGRKIRKDFVNHHEPWGNTQQKIASNYGQTVSHTSVDTKTAKANKKYFEDLNHKIEVEDKIANNEDLDRETRKEAKEKSDKLKNQYSAAKQIWDKDKEKDLSSILSNANPEDYDKIIKKQVGGKSVKGRLNSSDFRRFKTGKYKGNIYKKRRGEWYLYKNGKPSVKLSKDSNVRKQLEEDWREDIGYNEKMNPENIREFIELKDKYNNVVSGVHELTAKEKKDIEDELYKFNQEFSKRTDLPADDDKARQIYINELKEKLDIDSDSTDADDVLYNKAVLSHIHNTMGASKSERARYAERVTGKGTGLFDTKFENIIEDGNFTEENLLFESGITNSQNASSNAIKAELDSHELSENFETEVGSIKDGTRQTVTRYDDEDLNNKFILKVIKQSYPKLHKEYIKSGKVPTWEELKTAESETYIDTESEDYDADQELDYWERAGFNEDILTEYEYRKYIEDSQELYVSKDMSTIFESEEERNEYDKAPQKFKAYQDESLTYTEDGVVKEGFGYSREDSDLVNKLGPLWKQEVEDEKFEGTFEDYFKQKKEEQGVVDEELTFGQKAQGILDSVGGISSLIAGVVGVKGMKDAMKEIDIPDVPELSHAFKQHLYQTEQLSKMGFTPEEERKVRDDIDDSYRKGIDNMVRGTAGDRAKFLAGSGLLDANRSSALIEFAGQDAALRRENQKQYSSLLQFADDYNYNKSMAERQEEMAMQLQNKQAAGEFASSAFKYAMDGIEHARAMRGPYGQYMKYMADKMHTDGETPVVPLTSTIT